jgi:lysophospholipase L1-like esterase
MPRLLVALLCGSLLLGGCGEDKAPTRPAETGLRYGVIGDSYSNGEGVGPQFAWPTLLAQRLKLDLVVNPAMSGWTTQQAIDSELPQFKAAKPEVATLLIGVNDLVQGSPLPEIQGRFRDLLALMVGIVGGPERVVVVTVPDFSRKPAVARFGRPADVSKTLRTLNRTIRSEAARQHVAVADVFPASRRPTGPSPDGLHPSARELEAWTDAIEPVARRAWAGLG